MADIRLKVGMRIKELRIEKKLSQEQLGFIADIDRTYITSVEAGRRNISVVTLEKVIKALQIDFSIFFDHKSFHNGI